MSKHPDWSAVQWFVYETTFTLVATGKSVTHFRVLPRKLSDGESIRDKTYFVGSATNRAGRLQEAPEPVAVVTGCSRKTVLAHLKAGTDPRTIQRLVGEAAECQAKRCTGDTHNLYREWSAASGASSWRREGFTEVGRTKR